MSDKRFAESAIRTVDPTSRQVVARATTAIDVMLDEPWDVLPDAEFHALDTGHFALEDKGDEIAALMRDFLERVLGKELGKTVKAIEARNDGSRADERALRTHAPGEQPR